MEFFYVTEDFNFNIPFEDGNRITINLQKPKSGKPDFSSIYASTGACVSTLNAQLEHARNKIPVSFKIKVLNQANKKQIYEHGDFPIVLSNFDGTEPESKYNVEDVTKPKWIPDTKFIPLEKRIEPLLGKDSVKVFIVNGMGTGLGDGIIGLSAVNIFYKQLRKYFKQVDIDTSHTAVVGDKAHQSLYLQEGLIDKLFYLPVPVEKLMEYDLIIDNSAMIIRESFPKLHMIDFYLRNMSIDHKTISDNEKRTFIKRSALADRKSELLSKMLKEDPKKKLILLHTSSSTAIRSMPRPLIKRAIKQILDFDPNFIVVTLDKIEDIRKDINDYLGQRKNRHINLSFKSANFDLYVDLLSRMDGIITVDTSSYHIGDAFDIPTLVIFQTIEPDLRIKYYPYCEGVKLIKNNKLDGVHLSFDKKHQEYLNEHWQKFELKKHLPLLRKMMIKKKMSLESKENYVTCPVCGTENYNKASDQYQLYTMVKCNNCETEFSTDRTEIDRNDFYKSLPEYFMPNVEDYPKEKTDQLLIKYLNKPRYDHYIDFMQSFPKKGNYLDYPCNNGILVEYAKRNGFESYGIDTDKDVVEHGKKLFNFTENQLTVGDLQNNVEGMPEKFDVISTFYYLEQIATPKDFIKNVYDKLNPGGFWIFAVPNLNRLENTAGAKNPLKHKDILVKDYPLDTLQRYSEKSLRELIKDSGFDIFFIKSNAVDHSVTESISGPIPDISINVDQKNVILPKDDMKNFMLGYFQSTFNGIENAGDYIITIAKKPVE